MSYEEKPKMIITIGIPASGKSTWAKEFAKEQDELWYISERDEIRKEFSLHGDLNNYKFSRQKENEITTIQRGDILSYKELDGNVIVADTNLNPKTRAELYSYGVSIGFDVSYKVFDTPLEECIKRNQKRHHTVPESVLIRMQKQLLAYLKKPTEKFEKDLPSCIIVDVDGTLANHTGKRGPFDWNKVMLDTPIETNIRLIQKWANMYKGDIIVFTGRDECCLEDTKSWLKAYGVPYHYIFIRPEGSTEKDFKIKYEMYCNHIYGKYNVDFVMDDRKQVTDMWKSIGLHVLDVGNGVSDF